MANAMPRITIQGDAELMQLISSLPERTLTAVAGGMKKGAGPIISAAKSNIKDRHGLALGSLRKSIGVRAVKVDKRKMQVVMFIGPRGAGKQRQWYLATGSYDKKGVFRRIKRDHKPIYIAHLIEFGHRIAITGGYVRARPFLRPAVDANRTNMLNEMKAALKKEIENRAVKSYAKAMQEVA